jgi:hypothetical protein
MEQKSGLDLTPCHDQAGWKPATACTGFPTNPGAGVGDWSTLCKGQSFALQPTCGASPYDASPRADGEEEGDAPLEGPLDSRFGNVDGPPSLETGEDDLQADTDELPDGISSIDQAKPPEDTSMMSQETGAREVPFEHPTSDFDGLPVTDTESSDGRDGSAPDRSRLHARGSGCACRMGGIGLGHGWTALLPLGLLMAARTRRRNQSRRRISR